MIIGEIVSSLCFRNIGEIVSETKERLFRNKAALIFPAVLVSSLFAILDTVIVLDLAYLFFNFQIPLFFWVKSF